jgi:tetratricopeptide (TPR) repeat protein
VEKLIELRAPSSVTRWVIFILFLMAVHGAPCTAESPQDLFKAGNALYAEGKFSEASQKYQTAADQGAKSWVLEYNLGNAYYRAGQTGRAIAHYERAFRMNSGQTDVVYNLNLATRQAGDPELPAGALPMAAWRLFYFLSLNTLTFWTSALFLFFLAVGAFALVDRRLLKKDWIFALGLLFVALSGWLGARIYLLEQPEGVVVSPIVEVRSGPNTTYPANFTIPEGRRVLLLKEQEAIQGWLEIGVPQEGLKGWVPDTAIEAL